MNTVNVQGDPYWAQTAQNVAGLFNPRAQAQGAAVQAQARLNNAKAAGVEDQNDALTIDALKKAGYSDLEIGAMRAARDNSVASIFKGINLNRGREAVGRGDLVGGAMLTDQAKDIKPLQEAMVIRDFTTLPTGGIDRSAAALFLNGTKEVGGAVLSYDKDGKPIVGQTTPVGQSEINLNTQKAATVKQTGDVNETYKGVQADMLKDKTAAQIDRISRLTDQDIQDMVDRGADRAALNAARIQAVQAKQNKDASGKPADPIKSGRQEVALMNEIDERFNADFAQLGEKNAWALLDADQKVKLRNKTMEFIQNDSLGVMAAMKKAYEYYGVSGNPSEGAEGKKGVLWSSPDKKVKIQGFRDPGDSPIAGVVAEGAAPATTPAAPRPAPAATTTETPAPAATEAAKPAATPAAAPVKKEVKPEPGDIIARTQADIDNAPSGAIIYVNGQRMKKR
jgi:hypothetical protein